MSKNATARFVVQSRESMLDTDVSSHPTYAEAEEYVKALGPKGTHVDLFIVDTGKNTIVDQADDAELDRLNKQLETARKRKELLDLVAENDARAKASLAGQPAPTTPPTT